VSPIALNVNGKTQDVDADPQTPLLWVLRDNLNLTGTKFGCGRGLCAACTVHLNGRATRSCITPLSTVQGKRVTTIEGLSPDRNHLSAVQQAWIAEQVPQCGYCQSGFIMAAAELLARKPQPLTTISTRRSRAICADVEPTFASAERFIVLPKSQGPN